MVRVGFALATVALLLSGCKPPPKTLQHSRELRELLSVVPSDALRRRVRAGAMSVEKTRSRSDAFVLSTYATRSKPGYSARALSDEVSDFLLQHGVMRAKCDITFQWSSTSRPVDDVTMSGSYRVVAIRDAFPPCDSSWVAEAAWHAVPREGRFSLTVPARLVSGTSTKAVDVLVAEHVESLLARDIESKLHDLLAMDGATRFASRHTVYGTSDCTPEVCPNEDGIDALAILRVAQTMQDEKHLPECVAGATAEDKEQIVSLARMLCGMMLPRDWNSVVRERLRARPIFISKTTVVLQLATEKKEFTVNRNAFTDESDAVLSRFETRAMEFVSKLNAARLTAAGVDAADVEKKGLPPAAEESKCGKCGHHGQFEHDDEGHAVCPKCGEPEAGSLPDPLSFDDRAMPFKTDGLDRRAMRSSWPTPLSPV